MKTTIQKCEKDNKYDIPDFYIKANEGSDWIIINPKLVKRLELKVRPANILISHCFGILVDNGDSTELKS